MSQTIKGKFFSKLKKEEGTSKAGKGWEKQTFVIDTGDQYNPHVAFSLFGSDKIDMLKGLKKGEELEVAFNISSREYEGKWYTQADAWKVNKVVKATTAPQPIGADEEDDLPF
jgi:hypothetical protein